LNRRDIGGLEAGPALATRDADRQPGRHGQGHGRYLPQIPGGSRPEGQDRADQVLTNELDPLAIRVKKAVRRAVAKAGEYVKNDKGVKSTMKEVVKRAVKEAVKEAHEEGKD
jgi:hypothetical protein